VSHEEPLAQCQVNWELVKDHLKDSTSVRSKVDTASQQIVTLEKARLDTMEDIKAIRTELQGIRTDVTSGILGIRIWILGGVLGMIVSFAVPMYGLISSNGEMKEKVYRLERLHPYGSQVTSQGEIK
jgi:hypothetical protein